MKTTHLKEIKIIAILIPVVGIFIALIYSSSRIDHQPSETLFFVVHSVFTTAIIWLGCYTIVVFLWRKFPWEQFPFRHLVLEILAIVCYVSVLGIIILKFESPLLDKYAPNHNHITKSLDFFITLLITFFITSIHEAAFFYKQWKYNFSKSARLEKDNIEAKYETLKSQINPHFLFNSLNSLTSIVDDNKEAVNYIQNLSDFLRYLLKNSDRELVLVRDELIILDKYLSLQKSRFGQNLRVHINVDEKYFHYSLPPLVIQMLVENCIKHNIISNDKPLDISIEADKESISIHNNLQRKTDVESTNQGLKNIADRFSFFTSHKIKITENSSVFKVEFPLLTIDL